MEDDINQFTIDEEEDDVVVLIKSLEIFRLLLMISV